MNTSFIYKHKLQVPLNMNLRKLVLTLIVASIGSVSYAAPKGPPTPGCWPPATCIPINKGLVFLIAGGIGIAYLSVRKRTVVPN